MRSSAEMNGLLLTTADDINFSFITAPCFVSLACQGIAHTQPFME